jgi:uncharacterized protein
LQLIDGKAVFSATDLVGYLACEHLTALERMALAGLAERPHRRDRELDIIRERGFQHEKRFLDDLVAAGRSVVTVDRRDDEDRRDAIARRAVETVDAMASGADVIYQATFFDGMWLGYADFLLKVEDAHRPSVWGSWHYEVADTKLARHVKAGAVLQICSYVEQLTRIQGVAPLRMNVALGGSARETVELRVEDYMAYYRAAKRRFEEAFGIPPGVTYPEPVEHCDVCRWNERCVAQRRADDHLSLVAGISGRQRKALVARGIDTVVKLAAAPIPFDPPLDGTGAASIERVREQARIQVEGRAVAPKILYELLAPEPERGLGILPPPDAGDLFLDLEGDPYAADDGIDYLFGLLETDGAFTAIWSTDPDDPEDISLAGEKAAFQRLMDRITTQRRRHPGMHVYHYAAYEPTALKRLMGRHATREKEVDELLRGGVLVDLYRAVRQGLRASVESYSIKRIEPLYGFEREIALRDATSSIVAFEEWLQLAQGDRPSSKLLGEIEAYNRDDVRSTLVLRDWLERLRGEAAVEFGAEVARPALRSPEAPEELTEADERVRELADRLTDGVPAEGRTDEEQARWLLAQLLSWHRREAKVAFWEFFDRMGKEGADVVADRYALGPLEPLGKVGEPWRPTPKSHLRQTWAYRFEPQEYDLGGRQPALYDPALYREQPDAKWSAWKVAGSLLGVDDARAVVQLTWPPDAVPRHPESLNPLNIFNDKDQRAALFELGTWVADRGIDAEDPAWRAARDLLLRRPPRAGQADGTPVRGDAEPTLDAACRVASALNGGALAIQGPPGSGKTYTGARMIVTLLAEGKQVGVSATSHKVIGNVLREVLAAAAKAGVETRIIQKPGDDGVTDERIVEARNNGDVQAGLADGTYNVAAGTAWLWASPKSAGLVDTLFVDEAGQISLANVLAMGRSARNIVLLGDPLQLEQPIQGSHPPGAERSALAHLLGDHETMPEELGLFLPHTWRMHPNVTAFTSEAFYEGRLHSEPTLERQALSGPRPLRGAGPRVIAAEHAGGENVSPEEARLVADVAALLVTSGASWTDRDGETHPIGWDDVLIVAPYNAQVGAIRRLLPPEARVGTVDKFQGQEAPISIYSMTSSSPEDAPRGMDFLYSRHRLNVATSRARCIAVVVAEPALLRVRARTPEQMRLANALCQFVELAPG